MCHRRRPRAESEPVRMEDLRMEVNPRDDCSGSVLEWRAHPGKE